MNSTTLFRGVLFRTILMPADASINSSKSNKLPDLNLYLPKLAETHQAALRINLEIGRQNKLMENYLSLGHTPQDIAVMDREHLLNCFFQTFTPMTQIAQIWGLNRGDISLWIKLIAHT